MKRFIILTTLIAVFAAAPSSALAGENGCNETTEWQTGPYEIGWQVKDDLRTVPFQGLVGGEFEGQCRGFASGAVIISVKRDGDVTRKRKSLSKLAGNSNGEPLEFKDGYLDTGKPFKIRGSRRFAKLDTGDCVKATLKVNTWRFQENTPLPDTATTIRTGYGCIN